MAEQYYHQMQQSTMGMCLLFNLVNVYMQCGGH